MCDRQSLRSAMRALFEPNYERSEPFPGAAVMPTTQRGRRRLWELEEKLLCPVVGSCLDLAELKRVARKADFRGHRFDAYRLHVEVVSLAGTRNVVSERIQTLLERKYALWVERFKSASSDAEVLRLWGEHLNRGEVAGAMWAALTHPAASAETRHRVYADVHMLSHQIGAGQAADLRRMAGLERRPCRGEAASQRDGAATRRSFERKTSPDRHPGSRVPVLARGRTRYGGAARPPGRVRIR